MDELKINVQEAVYCHFGDESVKSVFYFRS
jgi:hypothetical protein